MKKILVIVIILLSVAALIVFIAALTPSESMQHWFTIGNFVITDKQPMRQWITDTPITDASAKLLKEKYGKDFVCSYYLYHMEYSLCISFKAAPADGSSEEFGFSLDGNGDLRYDDYINMLYMDELSAWLHENVFIPEIGEDGLIVCPCGRLTEQEAKSKTFNDITEYERSYCPHSFHVILITDAEGAESIDCRFETIRKSIEKRLGCPFILDVGMEGYYDPNRFGTSGGVGFGSMINYNELFYSYDCRRENPSRTVGKASESISG